MPPGPLHARQRRRRLLGLIGTLLGVVSLSPRLHERLAPWVELERGKEAIAHAAPAGAAGERSDRARSGASGEPAQLFTLIEPPAEAAELPHDPTVPARTVHYVELNPSLIAGKDAPFWVPGERVRVPLPGGRAVLVQIEATQALGPDRFTSEGQIVGEPEARAIFVYHEGRFAARFENLPEGDLQLQPVTTPGGKMLNQLYAVEPTLIPECGGEPAPEPGQEIGNDAGTLMVEGGKRPGPLPIVSSDQGDLPRGGPALVDVLVVYSAAVREAVGSAADVHARVELGIAKVNADFAASGVSARVRLAGVREVELPEDAATDPVPDYHREMLERLRRTQDGVLDEVAALRDEVGADLVSLLLRRPDATGSSGTAYVLREPAGHVAPFYGYSVVHYAYAAGDGSVLSHELGHNLGCAHARGDSGVTGTGDGAYDFSYGHRFAARTAAGQDVELRTIMAYEPGTRLPYFSNPRLTVSRARVGGTLVDLAEAPALGVPEGEPMAADNARTIERTAFQVASYRVSADASAAGVLVNVSTRGLVGSEVMIGGFVVAGDGPQTVLVRAAGPALQAEPFRVSGALADPRLQVYRRAQRIATNDDWWRDDATLYQGDHAIRLAAAMQAVGSFPFANGSADSALLLQLEPGAYTAVVTSASNSGGIALVEAYQQTSGRSRLLNLSTRAHATADQPVLAGFVVRADPDRPDQRKRMLLRVLGPSLARFGIPADTVMPDPLMRLHGAAGQVLFENDDWDSPTTDFDGAAHEETAALQRGTIDQAAEQAVDWATRLVAAPPLVPVEPAAVLELLPGAYTIEVRPFQDDSGLPGQSGHVLVEVYEVP